MSALTKHPNANEQAGRSFAQAAGSADARTYHKAAKINQRGKASALCYPIPHPIPDSERWTIRDEAVTCRKCLVVIETMKGNQ